MYVCIYVRICTCRRICVYTCMMGVHAYLLVLLYTMYATVFIYVLSHVMYAFLDNAYMHICISAYMHTLKIQI